MLRTICFLLTLTFLQAEAKPNCRFTGYQEQDIFCSPGTEDYVLKRGLVSEHDNVKAITLRSCRITEVEFESFHLLPVLEYLDLSNNKIKSLRLGVLDGFTALKFMNLSYNEFTEFPLGIFDQAPNLELLDLKGNRMTNIHVGILDPMRKLKHLDISSNDYLGRHLNPDIFRNNRDIGFIDFSRNDMTESRDNLLATYTAISFLNLDRCSLQEVPPFAIQPNLRTMKMIFLSYNKISNLNDPNVFMNLVELEHLNLEGNSLQHIGQGVLAPLKKLKIVNLSYNRLKHLPETLFRYLPLLTEVNVLRNDLEVLPAGSFRGSPVKKLLVSHNRLTFLPENFCLELRNFGASLSEFYFDNNPWQCGCLADVISEVRLLQIKYNSEMYDGQTPVCVTTNDFKCQRVASENSYYISLYYNLI